MSQAIKTVSSEFADRIIRIVCCFLIKLKDLVDIVLTVCVCVGVCVCERERNRGTRGTETGGGRNGQLLLNGYRV